MSTKFILVLLFYAHLSLGQDAVYVRNAPSQPQAIEIKWYTQQLISQRGVDIYRKSEHSGWTKLSEKPLLFRSNLPMKSELTKDLELKKYIELLQEGKEIKDLVKLAAILKSFESTALSKYLGIYFIDTTVKIGTTYLYKLVRTGDESAFALSVPITSEKYKAIEQPREIESDAGKNTISFRWLPETSRYYGMDIYRRTMTDSTFKKINRDPIILSGHEDVNKRNQLSDWFYVDVDLEAGQTYQYQFEGRDFFGSSTARTEIMTVYLKDREAPLAPDSVWGIPSGRKVTVHWKKSPIEKDLLGYNVYRTTKNDTDYKKLNNEPVSADANKFNDEVQKFGSYMYAVSSIDKDSNERTCNPVFVNVYDNEAPMIPHNIRISSDTGKIVLMWNKNNEADLMGYYIYRTVDPDNKNSYVKLTPSAHVHDTFVDLLPFNAKNRFFYKICALDNSLNRSGYSTPVSIRMPDVVPPQPPFIHKISLNEKNNPVVEWFQNSEADLSHYLVVRKKPTEPRNEFKQINAKPISSAIGKFTDRHSNSGTYDYAVLAVDSTGNCSAVSNVMTIKVKEKTKSLEYTLQFTGAYNSKKQKIELKWQPDKNDDLRGFVLFRLNAGEKQMTPITGCLPSLAFFDHHILKDSQYTYQVRAYHINGEVFLSKTITIMTN